ncbi:MAG: imidazoleglycerol-phosphate dehydratase HisB [Saccharofermentanales bacterium]
MRKAQMNRDTNETKVFVSADLDGAGNTDINTGIGFFDHMLDLFGKHSGVDLTILCKGDLYVDGHHSIEDIGIVLGQVLQKAVGDKRGIRRYGSARIPMDEALVSVDLDISGRSYLVMNIDLNSQKSGDFDTSLVEEFFRAVAQNSGITLHINCEYGKNDHHVIEAVFKAFARAFRSAVEIDPRFAKEIPSTKGIL